MTLSWLLRARGKWSRPVPVHRDLFEPQLLVGDASLPKEKRGPPTSILLSTLVVKSALREQTWGQPDLTPETTTRDGESVGTAQSAAPASIVAGSPGAVLGPACCSELSGV